MCSNSSCNLEAGVFLSILQTFKNGNSHIHVLSEPQGAEKKITVVDGSEFELSSIRALL